MTKLNFRDRINRGGQQVTGGRPLGKKNPLFRARQGRYGIHLWATCLFLFIIYLGRHYSRQFHCRLWRQLPTEPCSSPWKNVTVTISVCQENTANSKSALWRNHKLSTTTIGRIEGRIPRHWRRGKKSRDFISSTLRSNMRKAITQFIGPKKRRKIKTDRRSTDLRLKISDLMLGRGLMNW